MPFEDLQSFLRHLESVGELKRIRVECDPVLEIPEIAWRMVRQNGPALLFERVKGTPYPLAINLLASSRRIELALGRQPERIGDELLSLAERMTEPTLGRLWAERERLWSLRSMRTTAARKGKSQEVEEVPNLLSLPALHCWPGDGGRFFTLPMVLTSDPQTGRRNLGTYRMQVYDEATTGMHWQIQKGGHFHYEAAEAAGKPLEVAVAIGGDPALILASIAPLPENIDELAFAGLLRGKPTRLVRSRTGGMLVPANAEFVLEGTVNPGERRQEGPFGDHFGHYSLAAPFPVFRVKRVTRRRNPVYLAVVVGKPPQEDRYLGDAVQEITAPLVRLIQPEVRSLWAYSAAGFHNLLAVSARARYPGEGMKTALSLLGQGQTALTKCLVLVNEGVDPRDFHAVLRAIRANFDPRRDLAVIERAPIDTLDFTSFVPHQGGKMIISAVGEPGRPSRMPLERAETATPVELLARLQAREANVSAARLVDGALLVARMADRGDRQSPVVEGGEFRTAAIDCAPRGAGSQASRGTLRALMTEARELGAPLAVVVSPDVELEDLESLIWGIFTRFDPVLDVTRDWDADDDERPAVLGIDATWKEGYPEPVAMSEEIVDLVTRRWGEYGL